ncbi:MAG: NERD domain-containing protein [Candidatus Competibacter sp.]
MATPIPELTEQQLDALESAAEAKVYRALRDQLPADYAVFFRVGWILRREDEHAKDGEADFIVCHPDAGYLCIEVKGGGVGFDARRRRVVLHRPRQPPPPDQEPLRSGAARQVLHPRQARRAAPLAGSRHPERDPGPRRVLPGHRQPQSRWPGRTCPPN